MSWLRRKNWHGMYKLLRRCYLCVRCLQLCCGRLSFFRQGEQPFKKSLQICACKSTALYWFVDARKTSLIQCSYFWYTQSSSGFRVIIFVQHNTALTDCLLDGIWWIILCLHLSKPLLVKWESKYQFIKKLIIVNTLQYLSRWIKKSICNGNIQKHTSERVIIIQQYIL